MFNTNRISDICIPFSNIIYIKVFNIDLLRTFNGMRQEFWKIGATCYAHEADMRTYRHILGSLLRRRDMLSRSPE